MHDNGRQRMPRQACVLRAVGFGFGADFEAGLGFAFGAGFGEGCRVFGVGHRMGCSLGRLG